MAANTNTLTTVIPQLLAQGLITLRENAVMPRLVNSDYSSLAAEQGSTIDIPIAASISTNAVTPSYANPNDSGITPTKVSISLDQWREAPFFLTDKEMMEAMEGTIPMQAAEAVKALANYVDSYLLGLYIGVYNYSGVAGTTPFATDVSAITGARKNLNNKNAPLQDRRFVFDADAEANALGLRAFQDVSWTGDARGINEGQVVRKLGFDWFLDQNVKSHTAGTITGALITKDSTTQAVGLETIVATTAVSGGAVDLKEGDIIDIAGQTTSYVITENATQAASNTDVSLKISPPLRVALAGNEAITRAGGNHVANLAFHRDAIAFANRPLLDSVDGLGNQIMSAQDPVSGLTLRLEVSRQHKRTRWSYDILFGAKLVRPALACRVFG